ncbi:CRISPR-associated endoribonuclease Cas6 [Thermodesulfatator atlanticus]|uniref:CRISPR-associated endoribonuclease Cas6 n=1 Tax=Thermodesulfatator atlanticus TaxID=501497 RepID=UPI0003B4CFB8|nr:CRISPR-associated endoribonuclease Cas6 [Thermodesulfatator atlanticus]
MRISLRFFAEKLILPVHYNHILQAFIYRSLDETLARFYHEEGYRFLKRRFKLFTFSRLLAKDRSFDAQSRTITFKGPVCLKISAVDDRLLESLATYLVKKGSFRLGRNTCELDAVEVEMPVSPEGPVLVRAISPITTYSTLTTPEGKKKTYFYTPFEAEFSEKLLENLRRKAAAYWGEGAELPPLNGAYIRPLRVSKKNEAIVNFKGYWIKGWTGLYEVNLPRLYFELAYDAGLGAKNSQGFGMIEVVREER